MKRLFFVGVAVSLLVAGTSISWAETTVKSSKSNSSERVSGKEAGKGKGTKPTAASATQDPCASVKNDPRQFALCQDASHPAGETRSTKGKRGKGKGY